MNDVTGQNVVRVEDDQLLLVGRRVAVVSLGERLAVDQSRALEDLYETLRDSAVPQRELFSLTRRRTKDVILWVIAVFR